jgi:tryptophan synthase alpha chain
MSGAHANRLQAAFSDGKKKLVAYLTAGDPSLAETAELVVEAARAGADIIELGVPWSDPSADGPVIQLAMQRALEGGAAGHTLQKTLEVVQQIRRQSEVPIVLFGYYNPLFQHGLENIAREARAAGVDGVLVVDLPPEESDELDGPLAKHQLMRVPLLAPTTSAERAKQICARGGGFAYYVALTGVTGAGHLDAAEVSRKVKALRPSVALPLAVGFGIKDAEGARAVAECADAVVVGTALVAAIAGAADAAGRKLAVRTLISSLKGALSG